MVNLLPKKEKERINKRRIKKLVIILSGIFSTVLVVFILVLFLVNFYITGKLRGVEKELQEVERVYQSDQLSKIEEDMKKYSEKIENIGNFYDRRVDLVEIVEYFLTLTPEGLNYDNFSLQDEKEGVVVNLSGVSENRLLLTSFSNNLEQEKRVDHLSFSSVDWSEESDLYFELTFKLIDE